MPRTATAFRHSSSLSLVLGLAACVLVAGLSGCGMGTSASDPSVVSASVAGNVHGGQQPVTGSHIALFATSSAGIGAAGYGGAATQLAHTTTDASGNFQIAATFTCPTNQFAYLVATGGNPGLSAGTDNAAIFLVAALGPCNASNLAAATVNIDEVTTVAAAYALSGFFPSGGAGMTEAAVTATADNATMPGATTSSTNVQGLTDAFANANNIVNTATGLAYTVTPSNTAGVVPQSVIHAIADILQTCVNTAAPTDALCTGTSPMGVLTAATPPVTSPTVPANIFQAALNIAQYPSNNVATLFAKMSASPAFATTLTAAPNDWTIGVTYTDPTLKSAAGLGIDAKDNVYVTGQGYLIAFGPQGQAPSGNLVAGVPAADTLRNIAFDLTGNLFTTDDTQGGMWEYQPASSTTTYRSFNVAPANDPNPNSYGISVDAQGDVFTSSYSKAKCATAATECLLVEYPATAGTNPAYTPFTTFSGFTVPQPAGGIGGARGIAFDVKTGNVWMTDIDDNSGVFFTVTPSTSGVATAAAAPVKVSAFGTEDSGASSDQPGSIGVAVDKNSNAWFVITGLAGSSTVPPALYPVSSTGVVGTGVTGGGLTSPAFDSIDGNNNVFVANASAVATGGSVVEYNTTLGAFGSPTGGFIPSSTGLLYEPIYISIDRSGAVWVLSSGSGSSSAKPANVIQILGVAAPTNPVQAAGQYGVKP